MISTSGIATIAGAQSQNDLPHSLHEQSREWLLSMRSRHRASSQPLPDNTLDLFARFFDREALSSVRYSVVPEIEEPPFAAQLQQLGLPDPFETRQSKAVTFLDTTLLIQERFDEADFAPVLFYSLVRVVQYQELGVSAFVEEYLRSWAANEHSHAEISLEQMALSLSRRFAQQPQQIRSVRREVTQALSAIRA